MTPTDVLSRLEELGCHSTDASYALDAADLEWARSTGHGAIGWSDMHDAVVRLRRVRLALATITAAGVHRRLAEDDAIVLERLARGAGATRWYRVATTEDLAALAGRVRPGSLVSFYFDDRIANSLVSQAVRDRVMAIAAQDHDAVVAAGGADIDLRTDFVSDSAELEEFLQSLAPGESLFYGRFPAADDDGHAAITVVLPDADGVVRPHPY
jgi:hypothetical protein